MFKFIKARHRSTYIKMAFKYACWPERIYRLAHGHHAHNRKDRNISHELLALGIIHRQSNSSYDGN